jgi:putative Holliday junction resolvase
MGRIIAIDYGTKRIGLAVTDPLKIIATSLDVVHPLKIFDFLKNYDKKENIETFVVGHAKTIKNEDSDSMKHIKVFVKKLKETFPDKKIVMIDERFTSVIAQQTMLQGGLKKKARQNKETVDKISATLILQTYMQQNL